ncbi:hypothetical protein LJB77_00675 [Ruminococcaceae bacterium OttesenSCG-928-N02]|nr:hypothetical protein [Ruminococcaceae bacterium OttesenSCG-928-N02]
MEEDCGKLAEVLDHKSLAEITEAAFYEAIPSLKDTVPEQVLLAGLEYFTRKNLALAGAGFAAPGVKGAPAQRDTPFNDKGIGGAAKWRSTCTEPVWMMMCAVGEGLEGLYTAAMVSLFGIGCVQEVPLRSEGFVQVLG